MHKDFGRSGGIGRRSTNRFLKQKAMKQPDIKFNHGQTVFTLNGHKIVEFSCVSLKILCTYNGYATDGWGIITHDQSKGGLPYRIFYSDKTSPQENDWTSQELLFATKEDLRNSL